MGVNCRGMTLRDDRIGTFVSAVEMVVIQFMILSGSAFVFILYSKHADNVFILLKTHKRLHRCGLLHFPVIEIESNNNIN